MVRLDNRWDAALPPFGAIRERVLADWREKQAERATEIVHRKPAIHLCDRGPSEKRICLRVNHEAPFALTCAVDGASGTGACPRPCAGARLS